MTKDQVATDRMKVRDIVLFTIDLCQERPEFGKTSLQKVLYFIGRAMDRDLGHRAYFYGPYASPIETETEALVLSNLVEERVQSLGFAGTAGFPAKRYDYTLTESGKDRIKVLEERHPEDANVIKSVVSALIEHAGRLDQGFLSAAAKVDYIAAQEKRPISLDDVRVAAMDFGWSLTPTQVQAVTDVLSKLGLVEVKQG